jgi:hypothetical protein
MFGFILHLKLFRMKKISIAIIPVLNFFLTIVGKVELAFNNEQKH